MPDTSKLSWTALDTDDYFTDLLQRVEQLGAGDRVALMSMSFDPAERYIAALFTALTQAAHRGATVLVVVDAYSFMMGTANLPTGPYMYGAGYSLAALPRFRRKHQALEQLQQAGGRYYLLNTPPGRLPVNPLAGRSHIKISVVNNVVYIGGCNLDGTYQADCMVRAKTTALANELYTFVQEAGQAGSVRRLLGDVDVTRQLDGDTTLFIDAGVSNQSVILEQALAQIDTAQSWLVLTCQFFPNSVTAKHLAAAVRRGVNVRVVYNHPGQHPHIHKLAHHLVVRQEAARHPQELFAYQLPKHHRRLHAKIIASEQGVLIGSHNYVTAGVKLGTAEAAVLIRQPVLARQAIDTLQNMLGIDLKLPNR